MEHTEVHKTDQPQPHRTFTLVLAGGGARGLAHAGVLRALEHYGYKPSTIVGVSMGAIVGATYALNPDWYEALKHMNTNGFPSGMTAHSSDLRERARSALAAQRTIVAMITGWGVGARARPIGRALLHRLTLGARLESGRIPVAAIATDLISGKRVVIQDGNAADAVYASGALAGILPPLERDGQLLADGAYADIAPVDVARAYGTQAVIVVDPNDAHEVQSIHNGIQALYRALEICHHQHGHARMAQADLVLRPRFPYPMDALDFDLKRTAVAAGLESVRTALPALQALLRDSRDDHTARGATVAPNPASAHD